ncbi:MAG: phosphoenolpyruvate--protein phosphotransferase [Verrucomicrobium sp.]|nr:phosphoenolpyruvate--protein phosphotransferase [Verrucomicrobium sp.]
MVNHSAPPESAPHSPDPVSRLTAETRFQALPASPGVATGPVLILRQDRPTIRRRTITADKVPAEIARLEEALLRTRQHILEAKERLASAVGEKDAAIFDAHLLVVEDPTILHAVKVQLSERLLAVDTIYQDITQSLAQQMRELGDAYLRERSSDIHDVARRVLQHLRGLEDEHVDITHPSIVVADSLSLPDLVSIDRGSLLGFATRQGSSTSHAAIIARSLNIPAIVGLEGALDRLESGMEAIIDGVSGLLIALPGEETKKEYGQLERQRDLVEEQLGAIRDTLARTTDDRRVIVSANVELPEDFPLVTENGAEGVGLYRTEFLFLNRNDFPSEEEQYQVYRQIAQTVKPHSIIIRTLDAGGDKVAALLSGEQPEMNPFLGCRGIRLCLEQPEVFRTQLRAICRASAEGNVRVMFPMISDASELLQCKALLAGVQAELRAEGVPLPEKMEVGMMIEVPSAALTADILAQHVDFFSIGTNDLVQYTMAVDRLNERVANLYQTCHPSVLRLIARVVEAGHQNGIWVGICGEMANDVLLMPLFLGLGIDELSMGSVFVPRVKKALQSLSYRQSVAMTHELLKHTSHEEIRRELGEFARKTYPELLL